MDKVTVICNAKKAWPMCQAFAFYTSSKFMF